MNVYVVYAGGPTAVLAVFTRDAGGLVEANGFIGRNGGTLAEGVLHGYSLIVTL